MCLTEESKKRYKEYLEELARKKSNEIFSNGGSDHAIVLYEVLLDNTKKDIRIFCEEGISSIWQSPEVKNALLKFLSQQDSSIKILIENKGNDGFDIIKDNDNVEIRHIDADGIAKIHNHFDNNNCNFAVFDKDMFRYEYDKRGYKAYGSFNDKEIADSMIKLFDSIWEVTKAAS